MANFFKCLSSFVVILWLFHIFRKNKYMQLSSDVQYRIEEKEMSFNHVQITHKIWHDR